MSSETSFGKEIAVKTKDDNQEKKVVYFNKRVLMSPWIEFELNQKAEAIHALANYCA